MCQEESSISLKKVGFRPLATPDVLEFKLPDQHCCVVSDDGSHLSMDLVTQLGARGWRVVVLRYFNTHGRLAVTDEAVRPDFGQTPVVTLTSDDELHIQKQLEDITSRFGPTAAFIHVHPHYKLSPDTSVAFIPDSEIILRQVFFIAKYLQPTLKAVAQLPESGIRACFMTVTQLDGGFGLRGERDIDVIAGGLAGLTKTLALEWPDVFCRAVDVSPDLGDNAVNCILAELSDPNRRHTEVGWHMQDRVTLEVV